MDESVLTEARENQKTQFIASQFDMLVRRERELESMIQEDAGMSELVEEERASLTTQKTALYEEIVRILEASRVEEEQPYGVVLEVRAGAGGEEAALFAEELATNPYLRAHDPAIRRTLGMESASDEAVFAEIRKRKDNF